jgi:oxygen-independent coproporphyrinogen III oxidase
VALTPIRRSASSAAGEVSAGAPAAAARVGLYVHFPFCTVRCPYCDFAVDTRQEIPHDRYAAVVAAEIAARAPWFVTPEAAPALASIYFGGGTPGLWRPDALGRVVTAGLRAFGAAPEPARELTVEANPGEMEEGNLRALRAQGINRLSLGVQATEDRLLRAIGRAPASDAAAGPGAFRAARAAGFDNLSVDLMFGLPGQSFDDWRRSVDAVIALGPEHVSAYALTIERGTEFGARARRGELVLPDDEEAARMQLWGRDALAAAGLEQYEVSSYARAGRRAVHNSLYWSGAPYLGVGASASSFRPLADGTAWRFTNPRATDTYLRAADAGGGSPAPADSEHRAATDLENEAVWLGLRTADGIDRAAHAARFGADPVGARADAINRCVESGWLQVTPASIRPTPLGFLFADEIATRLWR